MIISVIFIIVEVEVVPIGQKDKLSSYVTNVINNKKTKKEKSHEIDLILKLKKYSHNHYILPFLLIQILQSIDKRIQTP